MKRPMLFCGFCALCCSCAAHTLSVGLMLFLVALFALLAVLSLFSARHRFLMPAFLICTLIAAVSLATVQNVCSVAKLSGEVTIDGTVCDAEAYEKSIAYTVRTNSVNGAKHGFKIKLISMNSQNLKIGDKITASAVLTDDISDSYVLSKQIYRTAFVRSVTICGHRTSLNTVLCDIRERISRFFLKNIRTEEASVMLALVTGNTDYIDSDLYESIRLSGVSHVIVVSGLHLSIITGGLLSVARKLRIPRKYTGALGVAVLFIIVAVTGFTLSAIRAAVAFFLVFAGYLSERRPDSLNSLFSAITFLCLLNPFVAGSVSFQLSSAATFGIIVLSPVLSDSIIRGSRDSLAARIAGAVISALFTSVAATVLTMPVVIWHFGTVSLISVVTNILISYPVTLLLLLCVISLLCFPFEPLYRLFLLAGGLIAKGIIFVVKSLGEMPNATYICENRIPATLAATVAALLLSFYCLKNIDRRRYIAE